MPLTYHTFSFSSALYGFSCSIFFSEAKKQEELVTKLLKDYNNGNYSEILALTNEKEENEENEKSDKKIYKVYGEDDIPELEQKEEENK